MRFSHTADWHLGRQLCQCSLIEDQAEALDQLVGVAKQEKPDAIVIAGDLYDRSSPSVEAVRLFDQTLTRMVKDLKVPILVIAGNHDSPDRLGFGCELLEGAGVHLFGPMPRADVGSVTLLDDHGPVEFYAIPYADPGVVRCCSQNAPICICFSLRYHAFMLRRDGSRELDCPGASPGLHFICPFAR